MLAAVGCMLSTASAFAADPAPVAVRIDASAIAAPINKHIYGQFLEHGGPIVNHGLWAEMIDDRKFYGPILEAEPPPPTDRRAAFIGRTRSWIRIGAEDAVTLAKDN